MKVFKPNYTNIDGLRPKVIETAKGFLLNTQYYDKEALSPVPFENLNILGSPYALNTYKQMYLQQYSWNNEDNSLGIIQDSHYENRFYFKVNAGYISGTRQEYLICAEEKNGEIILLANTAVGDTQLIELADQDERYLYFIVKANMVSYFYRYDKVAFTFANVCTYATGTYGFRNLKKVYSNETYIYLFSQYGMNFNFSQYNKTTNTILHSANIYRGKETTAANYNYSSRADSVVDLGNGKYGVYGYNVAKQNEPLDLYIVDTTATFVSNSAAMIDMQHVNITWNDEKSAITYLATPTSVNTYYRTSILEIDGTRYLNVYVYNENYENILYASVQGIYTFLMNSPTGLFFTGFHPVDESKQFGGVLESENKRHLLIAKNLSYQIMKFDTNSKRYEDTGLEVPSCYSVGFDELQRIWHIKTNAAVEVLNLDDAQSVQIKFEKTHYEYSGSTISTYITFSALNYLNEEMEGTFQLNLTGSAVFTENNAKELIINYRGSTQRINITITGANPITIYPKYIR